MKNGQRFSEIFPAFFEISTFVLQPAINITRRDPLNGPDSQTTVELNATLSSHSTKPVFPLIESLFEPMATRNRTNLYISYRQSYAHHPTQSYSSYNAPSTEELDTLISNRADAGIEMDILPPAWADTTPQVDEILGNITKMSAKLDKLHARHVLPGFDDKSEEEGEIERLTTEITKVCKILQDHLH